MRRILNTTTALVTSVSLALPAPLWAQEGSSEPLLCLDGAAPPCLPGQDPNNPEDVAAKAAAEAEAAAQKAAEEAAAAEAEAAAQKAAEEAAAAEAEAAAQKAAEEAAAAEAEAAAQKAAEEAAAAEAEAAAQKAAEEAAAAEAEAAAQKAAEEAAAAEAAAAAQKAAEEAAAAEAEAAAQKAAEEAAAAEAEAAAQKAAEEAAAAEAEAAAQKAAEEAAAAEAEAAGDAGTGAGGLSEDDLARALAEEGGETVAEPVPDLPVQPDATTGEAPVAAALEAVPAGTGDDAAAVVESPGVEVVEEVVTEEAVRASSEDFANKVSEAAPAAEAAKKKKKNDGLSDVEKALLVGLGAVAIGAIISNNRKVELNSGDRVVVSRDDGSYQIIKDDDVLIRQPGDRVRTETFRDGSSRTIVTRPDGSRVVTIRDAEYRVIRRSVIDRDGSEYVLIDDSVEYEPVVVSKLPRPARPVVVDATDEEALRAALARESDFGRRFSLAQVRDIAEVRFLVPAIDLDEITFETGSAAIRPDQARALSALGRVIESYIAENPGEIFLIEGHTDAVGRASYNLALSDRRAESVAKALTEYFDIPPENLVVQGYGEEFLKIDTQGDERANRRASVRRITDLLRTSG